MAGLDEYRNKRDFRRTPEPAGERSEEGARQDQQFVIQKHAASRLHFDLRLEQGGVFRSWAVPKGVPLEPGDKRLAVQVEDHPLEYGDFEGVIPKGEYGGGTVMLWDRGNWLPRGKQDEHHIDFELQGEKLRGVWTLVRMRGRAGEDGKNWLLIRRNDDFGAEGGKASDGKRGRAKAHTQRVGTAANGLDKSVASGRTMKQIAADRDAIWTSSGLEVQQEAQSPQAEDLPGAKRKRLPAEPAPQLATLVDEAPTGDDWLHEIKFDGYRILARLSVTQGSRDVRLLSRNGQDWTDRFPEIASTVGGVPAEGALLDGEVVAYAGDGSTSFRRLQEALSDRRTEDLVYQVFDLLHLDGFDLTATPQLERKQALEELITAGGFGPSGKVRYSEHIVGKGPAFYRQACGLGLEGIISKRASSSYRGGRGKAWLKVKCTMHEELLIGGYTEPAGSRAGFGALLLGGFDDVGRLVYAGKVGTGFSDRHLEELHARLEKLETGRSPFDVRPKGRGLHWVRPELVAEVEFTEWTRDGALRHPTFRGLREDREPGEITIARDAERAAMGSDDTGEGGRRTGSSRSSRRRDEAQVAGVRLTSPEKVLYPEQGVTKLALAEYYEQIGEHILPHLQDRPLSLVRCPDGHTAQCFFQKHPGESLFKEMQRVEIEEKDGPEQYLFVREVGDLVSLVQAGALELHVWGSKVEDLEHPDLLVFDLDPDPQVRWSEMLRVARELRERLQQLGLESFPRTTGGKGLHLVAPLRPKADWDEVKELAQAVAKAHAADDPSRVTANMSKAKRRGRIFLDYLRNGRGATAIATYSTRAREGATVAVPVRWDEVNPALRPDRYDIENLRRRLAALRGDPWEGFEEARKPIDRTMQKAARGKGGK